MPDALTYNRKENQEEGGGKTAMYVVGGLAVAALAYWYFTREAKADEPKALEEEEEPEPEPGADELYVSPDCKVVKVGSNWIEGWAAPRITQAVYAGRGLPLLSNSPAVLNNSMNAVVRELLQPWTDCAVKVPWADWYVAEHPVPVPQEGQGNAQFYQLMDNHRDAFVTQLVASLQQYPQFNGVVQDLSTVTLNVFLDRYNFIPGYVGIEEDAYTESGMSTAQNNMLRSMGYNIHASVVELFQVEFNIVMDAWVGKWYEMGMDIPVDNKLDNKTDDALQFAHRASSQSGVPWAAMVAQATEAGPGGLPPKEAPTS